MNRKLKRLAAIIELLEETVETLNLRINKLKDSLYDLQYDAEILPSKPE